MRKFVRFLCAHPIPGAGLFVGPAISLGSLIMDAMHLAELGLPPPIWAAIGLAVFFLSVIGMLYQWYDGMEVATSLHPTSPTLRIEPSLLQPREAQAPLVRERVGLGMTIKETSEEGEEVLIWRDDSNEIQRGIYHSAVALDCDSLSSDLLIVMTITLFNGSGRNIRISEVVGNMEYGTKQNPQGQELPGIVPARESSLSAAVSSEFYIKIEQRVSSETAKDISTRLAAGELLTLDFKHLIITVVEQGVENPRIRVRLWSAAYWGTETTPIVTNFF